MNFTKIEKSVIDNLPISDQEKYKIRRRINKLKKDPKGFIENSYEKRKNQVVSRLPIKCKGSHYFTVVSAVYNVDKYLDDYFKSLISQSLNFKKHIQLIMVDDGSTDNSAEIIKAWQKKYPKNITYLYKDNGGQASARNMGIEFVNTEWVTFIDPDDFVDTRYFESVDSKLTKNSNVKMLVANLKFYIENKSLVKDTHPLNFRFKNKKALEVRQLDNDINLSASSTFFETSDIKKYNLFFESKVKPNFEDGKFIADYLFNFSDEKVVFIKESIYFYRKREDGTSTLDSSWGKKEKFRDVFIYGFIPMLEQYKEKFGFVPKNIQKTVLYDMNWYIQYLINKPEKINFLSDEEKIIFYKLFLNVFEYIEKETIMSFFMANTWYFHKVGMLGAFKSEEMPFQMAYIEDIDRDKKQILVSSFIYSDSYVSYEINGKEVVPKHHKVVDHTFNDNIFVHEVRDWISYKEDNDNLNILTNGKHSRISLKNNSSTKIVTVRTILSAFKPSEKYITDGSWLLMDRETKADDNAEHLYRYLKINHPEQKCYFSLNRDCVDWPRLEAEGFELVEFGTEDFEYRLRKANKIITSHLEKHINDYFGDKYEYSKKFIFLQHGITQNNISTWLNSKRNIQCVISSTIPEYNYFVEDNGLYKLTEKEIVLTGFPRHDSLFKDNLEISKSILIMPTWRNDVVGEMVGLGSNTRNINKNFMQTNYAKHWYNLLHSKTLKQLVEKYDYQIMFAPHVNIAPYIPMFDVPDHISVWQSSIATTSIQQLFQQSKLMITDYSSVAFEMGFLNKTVLYYQFDQKEIFSGTHTIQQGYFSYEGDGFGPVVTEEPELLAELERILANGGEPLEPYAARIDNTFAYRDTNNCQRVYEAIINLDLPDDQGINIDILYDMTLSAYINKTWDLVESRSCLLIENGNEEQEIWAKNIFNEALFHQNKFTELFEALELQSRTLEQVNYWRAKVAFATTHWQDAIKLLEAMRNLDNELTFMLLFSYAETGQIAEFEKLKESVQDIELDPVQSIMVQAWSLRIYEKWEAIIELLQVQLTNFSEQELRNYQPQVLMAQAYRHLLEYAEAHKQLADFESHSINNARCRVEIARLAFARENYLKCINQYEQTVNGDINLLPESAIWNYLLSNWNLERIEELIELLPEIMNIYPNNLDFKSLYFRALAEESQWTVILEQASLLKKEQQAEIIYPLTLAKYRMGFIDQAYQDCMKPTNNHFYEYWSLIAEIAELVEDFELAKYCYKGMIAIYPNNNSMDSWNKLHNLRHQA